MADELPFPRLPMQPVEQPVDRMVVAQRVDDDGKMRRRDHMADELQAISLARPDQTPGQRKIKADMVLEARQEIGPADIRDEADADLRHAGAIIFAGHAMRAVKADADPAAKHEAVHQWHVRPDEFLQDPAMAVGRAVESTDGVESAALAPIMQGLEIATAAEDRRMRRQHGNAVNVRIGCPAAITRA